MKTKHIDMIHGKNRIGSKLSANGKETFTAFHSGYNRSLEGYFYAATEDETNLAVEKAYEAFKLYRKVDAVKRASFLDEIAHEIEALGDTLIKRASEETGLPEGRITGERGRTTMQLRMFATVIREGSWVNASIDHADPDRKPLPKPELRKMSQPLGPVVVFTASNFPLAYSTAGGDTASALAAGCPVIVKSHPSHPGTNELVADAVSRAAEKTGMPDGVFSSLNANSYETGMQLVKHPLVAAVGFTGSFRGGTALWRAANERTVPIPVFSEMGSTNPVFLLEDMLASSAVSIAETMAGSITLGAGQFCTNPGLMAGIKSEHLTAFADALNGFINKSEPSLMLSRSIATNYVTKLRHVLEQKGVTLLSASLSEKANDNDGIPGVGTVDFKLFRNNPTLHEEVFGPFSLLVQCDTREELMEFARLQKGQLTTSLFGSEKDFERYDALVDLVTDKAGRLIFNGVPTGVEVNESQQHGGPYPATTDSRFTSVGPGAIQRFVRPVSYQNAPQFILPAELQDGNPLKIWRKVDGEVTKN